MITFYRGSHVVVTGAFGFIGSHFVRLLNSKGIAPYVIDKGSRVGKENNLKGLSYHVVDAPPHPGLPCTIVHLGANVVTTEPDSPSLQANNVDYTLALLATRADYCGPTPRFIYASSAATYGNEERDFTERLDIQPMNAYAWTKLKLDRRLHGRPNVYGLRFFNCYDYKTEVLTRNGFKSFKEVGYQDEIATLNPQTNQIEYHLPTYVHKIKHKGEMVHMNGNRIDIFCTPDQNLYLSKNRGKSYELIKATDAIDGNLYQAQLKTTANWKGHNQEYEVIPACYMTDGRTKKGYEEKRIPMDKWLTFLGWFLSEGSVFKGAIKHPKYKNEYYRVNISQVKNRDYIREIYEIAKEIGFNPQLTYRSKRKWGNDSPSGITIHSKQLYQHLVHFSGNKHIPRDKLDLPSHLLEHLFTSLMKGDGHQDGSRYSTIYERFADDFQELLLKTGRTAGRKSYEKRELTSGIWRVRITENSTPQIGNCERQEVNYRMVPWDDYVYDVTVPNHIIMTRRNGMVCWSGNCYGPGETHKGNMKSVVTRAMEITNGVFEIFKPDRSDIAPGAQARDFIYVEDVCKVIWHFIQTDDSTGGLFNVGSGRATSFNEIADALGLEKRYIDMPEAVKAQYQYYTKADLTKLRAAGYTEPFLTVAEGIKLTREFNDTNPVYKTS